MILQPIVENALLHGLEDVPDGVVEVLAPRGRRGAEDMRLG